MALWGAAGNGAGGGTAGDAAREDSAIDDAGEDGPQRRARHSAADAVGLVPPGALQVDGRVRALLTARKLVQSKLYDIEMSLRGILRGFGLKVGPTTSQSFAARINHLVDGQTSLEAVAAALLSLHAVALREFKSLEKSVRQISRADARVRLLMSTPGVGPLVALTYVAAIDDPARFTSSKSVGAYFGLTPKKYQS